MDTTLEMEVSSATPLSPRLIQHGWLQQTREQVTLTTAIGNIPGGTGRESGKENAQELHPELHQAMITTGMMKSDTITIAGREVMNMTESTGEVETTVRNTMTAIGSVDTKRKKNPRNTSHPGVKRMRLKKVKHTGVTSTKRTNATRKKRLRVMAALLEMSVFSKSDTWRAYPKEQAFS